MSNLPIEKKVFDCKIIDGDISISIEKWTLGNNIAQGICMILKELSKQNDVSIDEMIAEMLIYSRTNKDRI